MDLVRRKLNSLGNCPIYEALKWSFQSTGARCLHGTVPCATASAGTSTPAQTSSPRSWALHLRSSPLALPAHRHHRIYGEKVSKRGLELTQTMETKSMLMPEFLLSHQTTLVLFCSLRDPQKRGDPETGEGT